MKEAHKFYTSYLYKKFEEINLGFKVGALGPWHDQESYATFVKRETVYLSKRLKNMYHKIGEYSYGQSDIKLIIGAIESLLAKRKKELQKVAGTPEGEKLQALRALIIVSVVNSAIVDSRQ